LFLGRVLTGLGDGVSGVFFATISDITEGDERIKKFGIIAGASGLGLVLGALLNLVFTNDFMTIPSAELVPLYILLFLAFVNIGIIKLILPETITYKQKMKVRLFEPFLTVYHAIRNGNMRHVFQSIFLFVFSLTLFTTFTPAFLNENLGLSQSQIGGVILTFGLMIVTSQLLVIPQIIKRYTKKNIIRIAFSIVGVSVALLTQVGTLLGVYLLLTLTALAIGTLYTLLLSSVSLGSDYREQGKNMGTAMSVQTLAQMTPSIVTAFVAYNFGVQSPLFLSAMLFLLAIIIIPKMNVNQ
jgi:DHA1 family tetracycline resistance protein-like MFS transporter